MTSPTNDASGERRPPGKRSARASLAGAVRMADTELGDWLRCRAEQERLRARLAGVSRHEAAEREDCARRLAQAGAALVQRDEFRALLLEIVAGRGDAQDLARRARLALHADRGLRVVTGGLRNPVDAPAFGEGLGEAPRDSIR